MDTTEMRKQQKQKQKKRKKEGHATNLHKLLRALQQHRKRSTLEERLVLLDADEEILT